MHGRDDHVTDEFLRNKWVKSDHNCLRLTFSQLHIVYIRVAEQAQKSVCPWTPHSEGLKELLAWNFTGLHSTREQL